jgi:hypothetical protein
MVGEAKARLSIGVAFLLGRRPKIPSGSPRILDRQRQASSAKHLPGLIAPDAIAKRHQFRQRSAPNEALLIGRRPAPALAGPKLVDRRCRDSRTEPLMPSDTAISWIREIRRLHEEHGPLVCQGELRLAAHSNPV